MTKLAQHCLVRFFSLQLWMEKEGIKKTLI